MSLGSSTTQTCEPSRRGSAQIRQRSSSETLPHTAQNRTPSRTLVSTAVSRSISVGSTDNRWNAIRCALFGPIPGSLPSSSIRSWTGPSNKSDSWQSQVAHPAGQRAEPVVREDGDLLGRVPDRADDQVLEGFDVTRVDDLRVDPDRDHLAAALHRDLHQAAAGLSVDLGRGQRRLRLHQLLLHLLGLSEECRHIGLATTGLHGDPLAYWSRLGFCRPHAAVWGFSLVGVGATVAPVPARLRVGATRTMRGSAAVAAGLLIAASTLVSPASAAPANIAGKIVFLDPGHNGLNDASISRQVPTGRGGTKDCQASGTSTEDGYPEHTFARETTLRIRQALSALGVRTAMSRGDDNGVGPCVDERAALANSVHPDAVVSIHADGGPPTGRGFHVLYSSPPLNDVQAGPSVQFAQTMRDQLQASGLEPSNYVGTGGLNPRSDIAGLNLAQYPSILIELGNMKNPADSGLITTPEGRQKYADAVVRGIAGFLGVQTR